MLRTRAVVGACALMGLVLVATAERPAAQAALVDSVPTVWVERFLASAGEQLSSYRALRTLEAEARGGKMRARMVAWTSLGPDGRFTYDIVEEEGSEVIRSKVLRAALEGERRVRATGEGDRGAIHPANYAFTAARSADEDGLVQVTLEPRRSDTLLIRGRILLAPSDGDLVRLEGTLVKRPSFWTRRVEVTRHYERIQGVRVPVGMWSTAQVLVVGTSHFSMTYAYASINGRVLPDLAASVTARLPAR